MMSVRVYLPRNHRLTLKDALHSLYLLLRELHSGGAHRHTTLRKRGCSTTSKLELQAHWRMILSRSEVIAPLWRAPFASSEGGVKWKEDVIQKPG
eukprot:3238546-Alexandrium_andersonii.AAC.1